MQALLCYKLYVMKIDLRIAKSLCQVREATPFVEYLESLKAGLLDQLVLVRDPVELHRVQGKAELLGVLLANIRDAREWVEKLDR